MIYHKNIGICLLSAVLLLQTVESFTGVSLVDTPKIRSELRVVTIDGGAKERVRDVVAFLGGSKDRPWKNEGQNQEFIVKSHAQQSLYPIAVENEGANVMDEGKDLFLPRALVLCSAALYGTNFTFVKILTESMPIGAMTSLRFFLASLFTFLWLIPRKGEKEEGVNVNGALLAGLEVGLWNSFGYVGQAVGLQTTDAGKSAFICSLAVVIVPILDALAGKKMSSKAIIGAIMALGGVALLEVGDGAGTVMDFTTEDFASYLQPIMFGLGFWKMEHAMQKYPCQARRITAAQLFAVFAISTIYCLSGGGGISPPDTAQVIEWVTNPSILGSLAWTGLITTALTIYMETVALKSLSAAETTLLFSTEPLWGAAFASFMLSEVCFPCF